MINKETLGNLLENYVVAYHELRHYTESGESKVVAPIGIPMGHMGTQLYATPATRQAFLDLLDSESTLEDSPGGAGVYELGTISGIPVFVYWGPTDARLLFCCCYCKEVENE